MDSTPKAQGSPTSWFRRGFVLATVLLLTATIVTVQYLSRPTLSTQDSALSTDAAPVVLPLPDKPSLAVLPFRNLSDDPQLEYFGDGIMGDLITDLSKLSGLFVMNYHSTLLYKHKSVKIEQVSKELGVGYIVEGSVRKVGERLLITAQLINGTTGVPIWAERYERQQQMQDLYTMQEEVRRKILVHIGLKLTPEDEGRLQRKYTSNLEAYGYFVRARELFMVRGDNLQARRFCEKAIALDPSYAVAYSLMGLTYWAEWLALANLDPQALEQAFTLARQALALDDSLPAAHELLGAVYLWRDKQYEQAIAEIERAITHHPHFFSAYYMLAFALNSAGRPEETIANAKVAMQLHPLSIGYLLHVGRAYFMLKRYEEAMAAYQKILATLPQHWGARLGLAMVYVELGREEEARAEVTEALRLYPQLSLHTFNERVVYKDPALSERTLAALRKAGLK